ncbi:MAG: metallophosphoesterase [Pseudomonadota bacterium]
MTTVLHISDTHFGTEVTPVCEALTALAHERRPDVLVYSGDITQRAYQSQFAAARAFCDGLGIGRMLCLPGNHDVPLFNLAARLWHPYRGYLRYFGPELEPVLDLPDLLVIGVKTTRRMRHKNGVVSQAQVERVAGRLAAARPGQLRIVVTHQPAAVSRARDEHDRLRGGQAALDAWAAAGADLVLGGHIHLPYVMDATQASDAFPPSRPLWCVQAGTAVSSRVRHGTVNSVNLVSWQAPLPDAPRHCVVQVCEFDHATGRFVARPEQRLQLD